MRPKNLVCSSLHLLYLSYEILIASLYTRTEPPPLFSNSAAASSWAPLYQASRAFSWIFSSTFEAFKHSSYFKNPKLSAESFLKPPKLSAEPSLKSLKLSAELFLKRPKLSAEPPLKTFSWTFHKPPHPPTAKLSARSTVCHLHLQHLINFMCAYIHTQTALSQNNALLKNQASFSLTQ